MLSESLPTGIAMPSAGHSSMPTAATASNSASSCPGCPAAAIQLAESLTSLSRETAAEARLVTLRPPRAAPSDWIGEGHRRALADAPWLRRDTPR